MREQHHGPGEGSQGGSSLGRHYAYKSAIDSQNSAMIAKLMSRKKSYERMMSIEENSSMSGVHVAGRSPNSNMVSVPDIN